MYSSAFHIEIQSTLEIKVEKFILGLCNFSVSGSVRKSDLKNDDNSSDEEGATAKIIRKVSGLNLY